MNGNTISGTTGGKGGTGGQEGTGGVGGVGAGIYLSASTECQLADNALALLSGGSGGTGGNSGGKTGNAQVAYAIYLEEDSLANGVLLSNTAEGETVVYVYGEDGAQVSDLTLTAEVNPTNWGKVAVVDSENVHVHDLVVANYVGRSGCSGEEGQKGCTGGEAVGILLDNCEGCEFDDNSISGVMAGLGGPGGRWNAEGGDGGNGVGLLVDTCKSGSMSNNTVGDVSGGYAGPAGRGGNPTPGGTGGTGIAVAIQNSVGLNIAGSTVNHITGGDGGSPNDPVALGPGPRGIARGWLLQDVMSTELTNTVVAEIVPGTGGDAEQSCTCLTVDACPLLKVRNTTCTGIGDEESPGHGIVVLVGQPTPLEMLDSIVYDVSGFCLFNEDGNAASLLSAAHSDLYECALGQGDNATVAASCISQDPLFANPEGGDFHLLPESPCIDAGKPSSECSLEPAPNGCQVNMGAYGNTDEATSKVGAEHCEVCPE